MSKCFSAVLGSKVKLFSVFCQIFFSTREVTSPRYRILRVTDVQHHIQYVTKFNCSLRLRHSPWDVYCSVSMGQTIQIHFEGIINCEKAVKLLDGLLSWCWIDTTSLLESFACHPMCLFHPTVEQRVWHSYKSKKTVPVSATIVTVKLFRQWQWLP